MLITLWLENLEFYKIGHQPLRVMQVWRQVYCLWSSHATYCCKIAFLSYNLPSERGKKMLTVSIYDGHHSWTTPFTVIEKNSQLYLIAIPSSPQDIMSSSTSCQWYSYISCLVDIYISCILKWLKIFRRIFIKCIYFKCVNRVKKKQESKNRK